MSITNRAAQFAPFAALTGYSDEIKEASRITCKKIEIDEDLKEIIDNKLQIIQSRIKDKPNINVTYFLPDKKKSGGKYITINKYVKKIDLYNKEIIFFDKTKIFINNIIDIDIKKANN